VRSQGVYFFSCHKDQVAERVIEVAGGLEISCASIDYAGFEQMNVLLVVAGLHDQVVANDERVRELIA
jgi:hypothetical protein